MMKFRSLIVLVLSNVLHVSGPFLKPKDDTVKTYHSKTGEPIAVDSLIQKYEREHQNFYKEETINGDCMMWPALDKENFTNYCRKYLQHSVPRRKSDDCNGIQHKATLNYEKEVTISISEIVILQCKIMRRHTFSYYLTRAPELNCVYALKCIGPWRDYNFSIINKHCDFEDQPIIQRPQKRRRIGIIDRVHLRTGEPIAKDEYLLEYELEHQALVKKEGGRGRHINWLEVMEYDNLGCYCSQYIKKCVPNRYIEGITGSWSIEKLHYQKLDKVRKIYVTTIKCQVPDSIKRNYHITRAPETNCVYALTRWIRGLHQIFIIIFKHCDFVDTSD